MWFSHANWESGREDVDYDVDDVDDDADDVDEEEGGRKEGGRNERREEGRLT